jgi:addiction module RelB/DinJ family antitoxin
MSRSAIIQARVRPEIKFAGERVLRALGLTMTDFMELALRRLIVDQKLPFEVTALDDAAIGSLLRSWEAHTKLQLTYLSLNKASRSRRRQNRE